jgi:hypothetical protein
MKVDGDFEDREGHQAPFTLQETRSLDLGFDLLCDRVEIRPLAGLELGVNEFTIDANFKSAAVGRNELHRINSGGFANRGCQTGSPRFIVSDRAIFDRNVCFHRELLSRAKLSAPRMPVKAMQFRRFRANYRLRVETGASTALRAPNTHALQLR